MTQAMNIIYPRGAEQTTDQETGKLIKTNRRITFY